VVNAREPSAGWALDIAHPGGEGKDPNFKPAIPPGVYMTVTWKTRAWVWTRRHGRKIFEPFFTTKEFGKGSGLAGLVPCNPAQTRSMTWPARPELCEFLRREERLEDFRPVASSIPTRVFHGNGM